MVYVATSKWSAVNISLFKRRFPAFIRILRARAYSNHSLGVVIFRAGVYFNRNAVIFRFRAYFKGIVFHSTVTLFARFLG